MTEQALPRSRWVSATARAEHGIMDLRTASIMLTLATLSFILSSIRGDAIRVFFPWAMVLASALAITAVAYAARGLWRDAGEHPAAPLGVSLLLIALALGIPGVIVVVLGEGGSAYLYAVYLPFLPSGLLVAAHAAVLSLAIVMRSQSPRASYFGALALVSSLGSPVLAASFFYFDIREVFAVGAGLMIMALAFDLVVGASAVRMAQRGPSEPLGT